MKQMADKFIIAMMVGVLLLSQAIACDTNTSQLSAVEASFVVIHASEVWPSSESSPALSPAQLRMISDIESVLAKHRLEYYSHSALKSQYRSYALRSGLLGGNLSKVISSAIPLPVNIVISGDSQIRRTGRGYMAKVELVANDAMIGDRLANTRSSHRDRNRDTALRIATRKASESLVSKLLSSQSSDQYTERYRFLVTLADEIPLEERERVEEIIENTCRQFAEYVRAELLTAKSLQYILFRVGHDQRRGGTNSIWSALKQELKMRLPKYSYHRKLSVERFLWVDISPNQKQVI